MLRRALLGAVVPALLLALMAGGADAAVEADEVTALPGWAGALPSRHYSGYAEATPGRFLHYWLVEAEEVDPTTAPLVLWLNGGPGCSSMGGMFTELGPLYFDPTDPTTLKRNPNNWARTANVVFLEQPIGVGFSYTTEAGFGMGVHVNDTAAAVDGEAFLRNFLSDESLFPELREREFYIAGESYAGIYIPTLADQITHGNDAGKTRINLVGLMIGNGCTGSDTPSCGQLPSASTFLESSGGHQLAFLHDHAMVSEAAFQATTRACDPLGAVDTRRSCSERVTTPPEGAEDDCFQTRDGDFSCPLSNRSAPAYACCAAMDESMDNIGTVNIYNLYGRCDKEAGGAFGRGAQAWRVDEYELAEPLRRGLDACSGRKDAQTAYLNRDDVRAAIHVKSNAEFEAMYNPEGDDTISTDWRGCGMQNVRYDRGESKDLLPLYARLAERPELRMLIFNGDVDACVPWVGAEEWVMDLSARRGWDNSLARAVCDIVPTTQVVPGSGLTQGTMTLTYTPGYGTDIEIEASGMTPGLHGVHIHESGDMSDAVAGTSMGSHYNPHGAPHGCFPLRRKVGDLGNMVVDVGGNGRYVERGNTQLMLDGPYSVIGRGLIVHALEDNCAPVEGVAGDLSAGARVGFCRIVASPPPASPASTVAWQPWTVNGQVAGYVSQWASVGFTFATVYGAGHMVPETRGEAAGALFNRFISGDDRALIDGLVRELQEPLTITKQPESVVVHPGVAFSLSVDLAGGQPPYAVTWMKDSRPLSATWQQAAYNLDTDSGQELRVESAAECHAGRYVCTATDIDGTTVGCGAALVTLIASDDPTACVTPACAAAAITSLPGWRGPLPSRHYSGYVDVSVEPGNTPARMLHYWLVEAEDVDPAKAPLVLWLNGGPGCSSMDGFWHEVGPFRVDKQDDTRIYRNPKSWAKIANMVFLEAPIGTGFSYTEATDTPHVGDETTALDSYTFLERFLGPDYFPQFQPHAFHIWGESYGGIYIPTLANQILLSNAVREAQGLESSINLVALGIGNGCSGTESASCGSRPSATSFAETGEGITMRFMKDHALISSAVYDATQVACAGVTGTTPLNRYSDCFTHAPWDAVSTPAEGCRGPYSNSTLEDNAETCLPRVNDTFEYCYHICPLPDDADNAACCAALSSYEVGLGTIDIYGIYNHCELESDEEQRRRHGKSSVTTPRQYILSELLRARGVTDASVALPVHDLNGCWGLYDATTAYLNRDAVRNAIHVRSNHEEQLAYGPGGGGGWRLCGMRGVAYDRDGTKSLLPMYPSLVAKLRILIFSGDADACVPYIGSQAWTSELAANNNWETAQPWHPWLVDKQVGGYVTVYTITGGEDFTFATVFNAGHMVPEDKPAEALALFKRFTYPDASGDVVWNPTPEAPLHIVSTMDPSEHTVGPEVPTEEATVVEIHLGTPFAASVRAAGGYAEASTGPKIYLYQWSKDGINLVAATAPTLQVASMALCDVGVYACSIATLDGDVVHSHPVSLVVAPALDPTDTVAELAEVAESTTEESIVSWMPGVLSQIVVGISFGTNALYLYEKWRGTTVKKATEGNAVQGYKAVSMEEQE